MSSVLIGFVVRAGVFCASVAVAALLETGVIRGEVKKKLVTCFARHLATRPLETGPVLKFAVVSECCLEIPQRTIEDYSLAAPGDRSRLSDLELSDETASAQSSSH